MTEKRAPFENPIDLRVIMAELDRDRAETQKILAEGRKANRDIWIILLTGLLFVVAAIIARGPEILTALGWAKH
jgi:hypothetical protein